MYFELPQLSGKKVMTKIPKAVQGYHGSNWRMHGSNSWGARYIIFINQRAIWLNGASMGVMHVRVHMLFSHMNK